MNLFDLFSGMQYPHWMMIGGGILVALGFLGFALRQNKIDPPLVSHPQMPPLPRLLDSSSRKDNR